MAKKAKITDPQPTDAQVIKEDEQANSMGVAWSDGEMDQPALEKMLASKGLRIVKLTDVTVTKDLLVKALAKTGKIPGNEIPGVADNILRDMIL